uniref:DUF6815 domain-containing protein n=1 Tax=Hanusia phi TaxID=3032 RepID=A0A7S0NCN6_9CRYP|mmetsp:Transcript_6490/g.14838  ORF Transcript_6490/g.14838 Transcript_6490/m.14838 type:complete len:445 (+) Transcript_6490:120-1454(+)
MLSVPSNCASWTCSAVMALNITATLISDSLFGSFGLNPNGNCQAIYGVAGCTADERDLLFGNLTAYGLMMQPAEPKGRIIVFGARGGDDKSPGFDHRKDTIPICNSLIELGWWAMPVFYSDSAYDLIVKYASQGVDGYISRVNPDVYDDFTISKYEKLLGTLADSYGLAAMAHPQLISKFGAKDALAKIAPLRTGLPDTFAYYDRETWRAKFPTTISQGPRVIKQNRGSQGEGIWIVKLKDPSLWRKNHSLDLGTELELTEAVDNHVEYMQLGEFLTFAERYLEGGVENGAQLIDQAFMPRISEGEVRVLFIGAKPVEILHKKPKEGGVSATLKSGATYTRYEPDDPTFARLMHSFVNRDLKNLLPLLGMHNHPLPLLWTADFILGGPRPPWVDGKDYYFIGELNCACVGITTQLHLTSLVAVEAIRISEENRRMKHACNASKI